MNYNLGAWGTDGRATVGMDGFLAAPPATLVHNPGFEYAAPKTPLGWTTTSTTGDADAGYTEAGGHNSQFRLTHFKGTAHQVRTYQTISNLPDGLYYLRAWVQNAGGQATCQLYASSNGTGQMIALPVVSAWTQIQTPVVTVTNGQCEIGLRSVAGAGGYAALDDVELVPASALATTTATTPAGAAMQRFPNPATTDP